MAWSDAARAAAAEARRRSKAGYIKTSRAAYRAAGYKVYGHRVEMPSTPPIAGKALTQRQMMASKGSLRKYRIAGGDKRYR